MNLLLHYTQWHHITVHHFPTGQRYKNASGCLICSFKPPLCSADVLHFPHLPSFTIPILSLSSPFLIQASYSPLIIDTILSHHGRLVDRYHHHIRHRLWVSSCRR